MKLVEYLFSDPGTPPTPDYGSPDYGDNSHMAADRGEDGLSGRAEVPHAYPLGDPIATLDGGSHHLHHGYSPQEAIRYRHILGFDESVDEVKNPNQEVINHLERMLLSSKPESAKVKLRAQIVKLGGTPRDDAAKVRADKQKKRAREQHGATPGQYTFEGGMARKCKCGHELGMHTAARITNPATGKKQQPCIVGDFSDETCDCDCFTPTRKRKRKHESLDEVLKRGVNVDSAKDRKVIAQLEGDQFDAKAEDGKGFCFHWADGRGVCGFTKKSDALCWLKESPRDVVRFWYGEPVIGNKQRRFKLSGSYTPKETDEGKKLEHGPYDNRAIGKLKTGKYPGRAEDGKGFCFVCASGAITAFRWRGDAMRWAQDQPREITKFWYGEPIAPSGKFRVRVRDRYRKDESHTTFSSFLEHRASA